MGANFAVLFYVRKNDKTVSGNLPIYLRVTIDGARFDLDLLENAKYKINT